MSEFLNKLLNYHTLHTLSTSIEKTSTFKNLIDYLICIYQLKYNRKFVKLKKWNKYFLNVYIAFLSFLIHMKCLRSPSEPNLYCSRADHTPWPQTNVHALFTCCDVNSPCMCCSRASDSQSASTAILNTNYFRRWMGGGVGGNLLSFHFDRIFLYSVGFS